MTKLAAGLRSFGVFWWDFIIGEDWRIAAGVIAALGATAALSSTIAVWWLLPIAVVLLLVLSLWRGTRSRT
jgi:hypothetical protein